MEQGQPQPTPSEDSKVFWDVWSAAVDALPGECSWVDHERTIAAPILFEYIFVILCIVL